MEEWRGSAAAAVASGGSSTPSAEAVPSAAAGRSSLSSGQPSAQDKLGKLLRLLSSDKDGEVLAATAAIKRKLATEGLDIHSLADALCRPEPRAEAKALRDSASIEDTDWYSIACECDTHEMPRCPLAAVARAHAIAAVIEDAPHQQGVRTCPGDTIAIALLNKLLLDGPRDGRSIRCAASSPVQFERSWG
jgi:hypothetical protein